MREWEEHTADYKLSTNYSTPHTRESRSDHKLTLSTIKSIESAILCSTFVVGRLVIICRFSQKLGKNRIL